MKSLAACLLLSIIIGLTYATVSYQDEALLESLLANQAESQNAAMEVDDMDVDDITDLQGMFNVLSQVKLEEAKATSTNSEAMAQFWGSVGKTLLNAGKGYLRSKYCSIEEQKRRAMIQDILGEKEDVVDLNDQVVVQLQTMLSTLNKVEAKMMASEATNNIATSEGWWKKLRKGLKKEAKKVARGYLC